MEKFRMRQEKDYSKKKKPKQNEAISVGFSGLVGEAE